MKIYFDCDDVISDLNKWIEFRDESHIHTKTQTIVKDFMNAFYNDKILDGRIIDFIKFNKECYVFATIPSISNIEKYNDSIIEGETVPANLIYETLLKNRKRWFISHNIPLDRVIFVDNHEDKMSYSSSDSILVDDSDYECRVWRQRGGLGLTYTDFRKVNMNKSF